MRATYDPMSDMAYIYLTDMRDPGDHEDVTVHLNPDPEEGVPDVVLDFRDGRLIGIELYLARDRLMPDLIRSASRPGS